MPDTPSTLIHYEVGTNVAACHSHGAGGVSTEPGEVTCFTCRNTAVFKLAQGVGVPTPLPQRTAPRSLKDIIAESPELSALNEKIILAAHKNDRGNYTIEELIHHGEYRHTRRVEVYDITPATIDGILMSSAYCYGSWQKPDNPDHYRYRQAALARLVEDLRSGRVNRSIGWSTFRLL